jgi:hypothetical protein
MGHKFYYTQRGFCSGERAVIFSIWNGSEEPVTDFLIIYSITGENRKDIASKDGRVIIFESQEVIYAAELILYTR